MLFKKRELQHLLPFYIKTVLFCILITYFAFQIPYFLDIGFSVFQIGLITSVMLLAKFLFEIPTGAIADI